MNCARCRELLSDHLDGRLPPEEEAAFLEALERCPDCRDELDELEALRDELRALPVPAPPIDLGDRLRRAVAAEAAAAESPASEDTPGLVVLLGRWRIAAAVLAVGFGVWALTRDSLPGVESPVEPVTSYAEGESRVEEPPQREEAAPAESGTDGEVDGLVGGFGATPTRDAEGSTMSDPKRAKRKTAAKTEPLENSAASGQSTKKLEEAELLALRMGLSGVGDELREYEKGLFDSSALVEEAAAEGAPRKRVAPPASPSDRPKYRKNPAKGQADARARSATPRAGGPPGAGSGPGAEGGVTKSPSRGDRVEFGEKGALQGRMAEGAPSGDVQDRARQARRVAGRVESGRTYLMRKGGAEDVEALVRKLGGSVRTEKLSRLDGPGSAGQVVELDLDPKRVKDFIRRLSDSPRAEVLLVATDYRLVPRRPQAAAVEKQSSEKKATSGPPGKPTDPKTRTVGGGGRDIGLGGGGGGSMGAKGRRGEAMEEERAAPGSTEGRVRLRFIVPSAR